MILYLKWYSDMLYSWLEKEKAICIAKLAAQTYFIFKDQFEAAVRQ
jgi:hypothetical protein